MRASAYHVLLRVSSLTLALILLFDSGILFPITKELSQNAQQYLVAAVGASASVGQNEINKYTTELSQRARDLEAREAALAEREISVNLNTSQESSNISTYILSVILFILVVLIVLNYILDFVRERRLMYQQKDEQTA